MEDGGSMFRLMLATGLLLVSPCSCFEENLSLGRPSLLSATATPLSSCSTGSHLDVDSNFTQITDDCACAISNGTWPPATRDWYLVQFPPALVRAVRLAGINKSVDVLVGDDFNGNASLDNFTLCATYNASNSGQNVSCATPTMGSVVAVRAQDNNASLRLCDVDVFGFSGNLLRAYSDISWRLSHPNPDSDQEEWRLVDGNLSSCVEFHLRTPSQTSMTAKLRIPDGVFSRLRVLVYYSNVPVEAMRDTQCKGATFDVYIITDYLKPLVWDTRYCSLVRNSVTSSVAEFDCPCTTPCRGDLAIDLFNIPINQRWRICEVIAIAPETESFRSYDDCASPPGAVGVAAAFYDDSAWSASSLLATYAIASYARYNYVPVTTASLGAWCPATATVSWVGIDLDTPFKIRAVVLQGGSANGPSATYINSYVTSFSVSSAIGQSSWQDYLAVNGSVAVFSGVSHPSTPVLRSLSPELIASRVRLFTLSWIQYPCLRFELIGCPIVKREWTSLPIPSMSGPFGVSNSNIKSSSFLNSNSPPPQSRIGSILSNQYYTAWVAGTQNNAQYLDIDFGTVKTVLGIAIRGRMDANQWINNFNLLYKTTDTAAFTTFAASPLPSLVNDQVTIMYQTVYPHFDAKVVRMNPTVWTNYVAVRMEIYTASTQPTLISKKVLSDCDPGYKAVSSYGCYRYVNQPMSYSDAVQFCAADGAHLARVRDYDEWNAVNQWLPKTNLTALYRQQKAQGLSSKYMGCYIDAATRDLDYYAGQFSMMTRESCEQICVDLQYHYASFENANYCFCGNRLGLYGRTPETDCNVACQGNTTFICGGLWRSTVLSLGNWTAVPHVEWTHRGCFLDDDDQQQRATSVLSATTGRVQSHFLP